MLSSGKIYKIEYIALIIDLLMCLVFVLAGIIFDRQLTIQKDHEGFNKLTIKYKALKLNNRGLKEDRDGLLNRISVLEDALTKSNIENAVCKIYLTNQPSTQQSQKMEKEVNDIVKKISGSEDH